MPQWEEGKERDRSKGGWEPGTEGFGIFLGLRV